MASSSGAAPPAAAVQPADNSRFDLALLEKALPAAEDNAPEVFPLITLVLPNGVAKTGHIALAADLHFLGSSSPPEKKPTSLMDFGGSRVQHFALERLEDNASTERVAESLKRVRLRGKHGVQFRAVCLHSGLRNTFQGLVRNDKPESPCVYTILADTKEMADSLHHMLEPRVLSWTALEDRMRDARSQFERQSREGGEQSVGPSIAEPNHGGMQHPEHAKVDKLIELAAKANAGASWGSTVAAAGAAVACGAEMSDALARSLGGVAFVGPALQLAAFVTRAADVVVKASSVHNDLVPVYARLHHGMRQIVGVACRVGQGHAEGDAVVRKLFGSLRACWSVMQRAERIILGGVRKRVRNWNAVADFRSDLDELEKRLDSLDALTYTAMLDREISRMRRDVADQSARLGRVEEVSSRNQASADSFVTSYALPLNARLKRFVPSALPKLDSVKSKLRRTGSVAVTGAGSTVVVGQGGVGKTTACVAVCHADDVRFVFRDGIHFFEFDLSASDADVADMLFSAVRDSGGCTTADRMKEKFEVRCGKGDPIIPLVREARNWFAGRSALFVFDNIYFREAASRRVREWPSVLIDIVGSAPKSAVLISTRARTLVNDVVESRVEFDVLDGAEASEKQAAMDLINTYASKKVDKSKKTPGSEQQHAVDGEQEHARDDNQQLALDDGQKSAREKILQICGGLQLAICIAGNMVLKSKGDWVGVCSSLEKTNDALLNDEIDTVAYHIGLSSVMKASLEMLDDRDKGRGRFEGYTQNDLREVYGDRCFARLYGRFGLLESARSVPVELFHALVGDESSESASRVKAVVQFFEEFGLATVRAETHSRLVIELHDMEHSFAKSLLGQCGGRGSVKFGVAHEHRAFVERVGNTLLRDKEFGAEVDWSGLWDESREYWRAARSYMKSNLVRHMVEGISDAGRARDCCCGESCCVPSVAVVRKGIVALLCDFRWIRARALDDGRSALLGDFTRLLRAQAGSTGRVVCTNSAESAFEEERGEPVLQNGEFAAIEHIYRLCCRVHSTCMDVKEWRCREHAREGGDMASGILRGIDSDDIFGSDDRLDDDGKREAQEVVSRLAESIRTNVKGPYLRLLRPFVGSVVEDMAKGAVREMQWGMSVGDSLLGLPETFGILAYQRSTGELSIRDMRNLSAAPEILVSDMAIRGVACTTAFGETQANFIVAVTKACNATIWRIRLGVDVDRKCVNYATLECEQAFSLHFWESATCVAVSKGARVVAVGTDTGVIVLSHKAASCGNGEIVFTRGARIDSFGGAVRSLHLPYDEPWAVALLQGGDLKRWCMDEDVRLSLGNEFSAVSCVGRNMWAVEFVGDSSAYTVERGMAIVTKMDLATKHSTAVMQASQGCSDVTALAVLVGHESAMVICVGRRDGRVECWTDFGGGRECVLGISVDTGSEIVSTALLWRQAGGTSSRSRRVFDVVSTHVDGLCRVATGVVLVGGVTALWDDVREREVLHVSTGSGRGKEALYNGVEYVEVSARGGVVLSGHQDGSLRVWDVRTGALRMQMKANSEVMRCVDASGDGSVAVLGGWDKHVRVWELGASSRERHVLRRHESAVSSVILSHCARWAVSGDEQGFVCVWDIERGTCLDVVSPETDRALRLVSDIRRLASCIRSLASDSSNDTDERAVAGARVYCTPNRKSFFVTLQDRWDKVASRVCEARNKRAYTFELQWKKMDFRYHRWLDGRKAELAKRRINAAKSVQAPLSMLIRSETLNVSLARACSAPLTPRFARWPGAVTAELKEVLPGIISLESQATACGCSPRDAVLRSAADPRLTASAFTSRRFFTFSIRRDSHVNVVCTERGSLRMYEVANHASGLQAPSGVGAERRGHALSGKRDQVGGSSGSLCNMDAEPGRLARGTPGDYELLQQQVEEMESKVESYLKRLEKNALTDPAEKCDVTNVIQSLWTPWRLDPVRVSLEPWTKFSGCATLVHGGHGTVYEGLLREPDEQKSIRVAVKVLDEKFSGTDVRMDFFREASLLHALRHPCILKFYGAVWPSDTTLSRRVGETLRESDSDSGASHGGRGRDGATSERDDVHAMLVTERMTCTAMDAKRSGVLCSRDRVWQVLVDVAEALEYVHGCGVLHVDVKAENVLLRLSEKLTRIEGRARLSDVGVSRRKRATISVMSISSESSAREVRGDMPNVGTMTYMAPELMAEAMAEEKGYGSQSARRAGEMSGACDVWSFGVLLCVLGCDTRRGVLAMSEFQVATCFKDGNLLGKYQESVRELGRRDGRLAAIAAMCLQEDASERPTIADVRSALQSEAHEGSNVAELEVVCSAVVNRVPESTACAVYLKNEENSTRGTRLALAGSRLALPGLARREANLRGLGINLDWRRDRYSRCFSNVQDSVLDVMCKNGGEVGREHATSAEMLRKLAEAGSASGQAKYGRAFEYGEGVSQSYVEAVKWYSASAEQGNAVGENELGCMYGQGRGVGRDHAKAAELFRKSAEARNASGQINYGRAFEYGEGVGQSDLEAVKWYSVAAVQGDAQGLNDMGRMYWHGYGVERDTAKAAELFYRSAEAGNAGAQVNYGLAFEYGEEVGQSDVGAVKLYSAAAEQGDAQGLNDLGRMYWHGYGVERDTAKAKKLFQKGEHAAFAHWLSSMSDAPEVG